MCILFIFFSCAFMLLFFFYFFFCYAKLINNSSLFFLAYFFFFFFINSTLFVYTSNYNASNLRNTSTDRYAIITLYYFSRVYIENIKCIIYTHRFIGHWILFIFLNKNSTKEVLQFFELCGLGFLIHKNSCLHM